MIDVAAISMILVSLKMNTAMMTHYYDFMDDEDKQFEYLRNIYTGCILLGIAFLFVMYFAGEWLFGIMFKDEAVRFFPYGIIVIVYALLFEATQTYLTFLKNRKNVWQFTFIMLLHVLSIVLLQFLFIIVLKRGVTGALEGILVGNILVTLVIMFLEPKLITFRLNFEMLSNALKFSVLLVPYLVIYWFLTRGGRIFLESYTNLEEVAVFALLMILGSVIILSVEAVINGVRPFLFEQFAMRTGGDARTISLLTKMIINIPLLFVPTIVLVSCFVDLISKDPIYKDIADYMPATCLLYFTLVIARLFYQQLLFAKKSHLITTLSVLALVILIAGFFWLIPRYEIWGVISATIVANVVMGILFFVFAQKAWYVKYSFNSIILAPTVVFASLFALKALAEMNAWSYKTFGGLQFIIGMLIILAFNYQSIREYADIFKENVLN